MTEIELKFVVDEDTARKLWQRGEAARLLSGRPRTMKLTSTYLDTPDQALWKAGIALRLRRDGRRWIQTVKTKSQLHGGLMRTAELEAPAPGGRVRLEAIDDTQVRERITQLVDGAPLRPVCETVMTRTAGELRLTDGTRAMLSTDAGEIRAGARRAELREAEIELIEGRIDGLFKMVHTLMPAGGIRFSRLSKAARGYMLATDGRIDQPDAPRLAVDVPLRRRAPAGEAARDVLRECLEQIAANMLFVEALDDPEGPHQLRIGLRRLRSALAVFAPVLGCPEVDHLGAEARWLGQEVSHLRDLDVVRDDIVLKQAALHPGESGLATLAEALQEEAGEARSHLRAQLIGHRAQAFLIDLVRFIEAGGWLTAADITQCRRLTMPVIEVARKALAKHWKRVCKRARHLAKLEPAQRHELRKELKKLRYAAEFFASLFPAKRTKPFLKHLKAMQDVFGDLNDAVVLKTLFSDTQPGLAADPRLQRPIGWVIGASEARAEINWTGAKALWKELEATRLFWT